MFNNKFALISEAIVTPYIKTGLLFPVWLDLFK